MGTSDGEPTLAGDPLSGGDVAPSDHEQSARDGAGTTGGDEEPGIDLCRRVPTDWLGRYRFDDDPGAAWGDCRMIDISIIGVGLELLDNPPPALDLVGRRLALEVQASVGESAQIRLVGEVKYAVPQQDGMRVGMEFVSLSETEQKILHVMELLRVGW